MVLDELRSTLFSAGLRRLLADTLHPSERVLWQGRYGFRCIRDASHVRNILERARGANANRAGRAQ